MSHLAFHPLLQAVGWALVHSLWQGALVALLAAPALHAARHRSPELRHALACAALGLLVLSFLGTLLWLSVSPDGGAVSVIPAIVPTGEGPEAGGWLLWVRKVLGPWIPWLFAAWLLGVGLRLIHLGRALAWLYGPCLRSLQPPSAAWLARFEALKRRCGVDLPVRFGLSDRVDTLVAFGWLKPVVLVPAAALLALSPEALEALLAHELAHVRRRDFLANLVQAFAEALLFHHPAVWWLSRRIRQEREHCCDDAAVRACGDSILYASALAELEALRSHPNLVPDLAPAASGGKLMSRIQRILRPQALPRVTRARTGLLPILLLSAALGVATLSARVPASSRVAPQSSSAPAELPFDRIRVRYQPPAPPYPPEAKEARIQGTVVVLITTDAEGQVTGAEAISGPPELHECAVGYAMRWTFEPVELDGKAVPVRFRLTMPFRLK